ncbi:MAG: RagB/SusD family nutrient uptake outer membrane protein [Bacteroidales bacterium]|nr:RagB/SusD family nutrient uptake outer membrane protein [Bacteroidales bacterium]
MKRIHFLTVAAAVLLAAACTEKEGRELPAPAPDARVFYAEIETSGNQTRVANDGTHIFWEYADAISVFDHGDSNRRFLARPQNGNTAAAFYFDGDSAPEPENTEPYAYALFPYADNNVFKAGTIHFSLPATQTCSWANSFSGSSNPMMAVTENNVLKFKNLCGFLVLKLYGTNISVSSIVLTANAGETLCGPAYATMALGEDPELTMENYSTGSEITLECPNAISISNTGQNPTSFWFVLPAVTMSEGFTITLTDKAGGVFTKSVGSSIGVTRNNVTSMAPLEVVPVYTDISPAIEELLVSIGKPCQMFNTPDDWGILMTMMSNDMEGADAFIPATGYNYFSVCNEYSSRNTTYRNTNIRFRAPMNLIERVNELLTMVSGNVMTDNLRKQVAQLRALRAWANLILARGYQFNYQTAADQPCIPLLTENTADPANNPRATVQEVYEFILEDLDFAVTNLEGFVRTSKMQPDASVARGLRARAYLDRGEWAKAYSDAEAAAAAYSPATVAEVSVPSFMDISEHNWIWGYDMPSGLPASVGGNGRYATTSSWLRSFSANAYATATQTYTCINTLLWDKIPASDVRKGWWVDGNLESPLLEGMVWPGFNDVPNASDGADKLAYLPFTNVKFGCNPIATKANDEDMPLMRVEEMILVMAEAKARLGENATAINILETFVLNYRDPSYSVTAGGRTLLDEIWFQRRVELWGEGFALPDIMRLGKPLVRFHDTGNNIPDGYRFNIPANDPWLLLRFPVGAINANQALVNNDTGAKPEAGQNPELRDGVTD